MTPDTTVTLGDFEFSGTEIPEVIAVGGSQRTAVHELIGGIRIIDCMGRADSALELAGLLRGTAAVARARYLDTLRIQGTAQALTWSEYSYSVIVSDFKADYQRSYQIPFHLTLTVVADLANLTTSLTPDSIDTVMTQDSASVTSLAAGIPDSLLSTLLAALNTAIAAVASFANVAQSVINSVLQPLVALQSRVLVLLSISAKTLASVTSFGGVLANVPAAVSAQALTAQAVNLATWDALFELSGLIGRMITNLSTVKTAPNVITVAGGNLFQIAAQQYGDAMAWTGIAKANGLTDPFLTGTVTLYIPALPDSSGGILSA